MSTPNRTLLRIATACIATLWAVSTPAEAALRRYEASGVRLLVQQAASSPEAEFSVLSDAVVFLTDESGANPVLKRWVYASDNNGITIIVPSLSGGFGFFNNKADNGPAPNQTGTGSSASSINWGNLGGWTESGALWCHSIPSYVCSLGGFSDLGTVAQSTESTNFDIGTWVFHGTGFVQTDGYIFFTSSTSPGNSQRFLRAPRADTGVVPALPLLGIATVTVSVIGLGVSAARRHR